MPESWKTSDFDYALPPKLIAQYPLTTRSASRLMCIDLQQNFITHRYFRQLKDLIKSNDLLVFNDTKVIPARILGHKESGGQVECLVERVISRHRVVAHIRASKPLRPGNKIHFAHACVAEVIKHADGLYELEFQSQETTINLLHRYGQIPLPPYIKRSIEPEDLQRYQTIFAQREGAVAAPTAGLHFDEEILQQLAQRDVAQTYVTLHVGAGTFQPIRAENLVQHQMHQEWMEVSPAVCAAVENCRQHGGRVVAVGTTVIRCLETAAKSGLLKPYQGETNLFIYPGFQFQVVDAVITNFHLPKSSLLMLVCAFGGYERIMQAYQEAIAKSYRFFSYGDAMYISSNRSIFNHFDEL